MACVSSSNETVAVIPTEELWKTPAVSGGFLFIPILEPLMWEATLDSRGRLALPKEIRERYGKNYHIVELHDGIKLVPIADNPLSVLREEFSGVEKSADELRERARHEALDEAGQ